MSSQDQPIESTPARVAAVYSCARKLLSASSYSDAAVLFRLMLHLAPTDERSWLGLGVCHEKLGQLNIARELYAMGTVATESPRCHIACARVLRQQELTELASEQYSCAIELAGQDDPDLLQMARQEIAVCHE